MGKRILIVDDHAELRKLVRLTLDCDVYELYEAENGTRALELIDAVRPEVVILDVMMPGALDGYQVCERIKTDPQLAATGVVLLTARGQQGDLEEGKRVKADAYLVKPFSPLALMDLVEKLHTATPA